MIFRMSYYILTPIAERIALNMRSQKELDLAYKLAAILFIVGVLSFAAFSAPTPEQPVRIMLKSVAGKVLFDHKTHTVEAGYGLDCSDCHHNLEPGESDDVEACGGCHEPETDDEDMLKRSDAFHGQCIGCHEDFESGPTECASCHVM